MKGLLFMSKKPRRTPEELVRKVRDLLIYINCNNATHESKRQEKRSKLQKLIREMKILLYGDVHSDPVETSCARLTQEFFKDDTFRLLILCLPKLVLGTCRDITHVVDNLQRQQVKSRLIASDYLEQNIDIMDILVSGYEDPDFSLFYGSIFRASIRHQAVAKYVLDSNQHMKKLFDLVQFSNFDIASDATETFKELLTRHRSIVAEFLSRNYDWFFGEYNSKLLLSTNYVTRWCAIKLLGEMFLHSSNCSVMTRYVSSLDNMRIVMNLLKESSKNIQLEAFQVFKYFAASANKPPEIVHVLVANKAKLLQFFADFEFDKEDEQFVADRSCVVEEIATLEFVNHTRAVASLGKCRQMEVSC